MYLLPLLIFGRLINGYGYNVHSYLGGVSDKYLSLYEPEIYKEVINLTETNLSSISSWADKIKRTKEYSWTATLHYIDILECKVEDYNKDIINKHCKNKCIVSIIKDFTNSLKYNKDYNYTVNGNIVSKSDQLKFLVHFIQDFNQPMHLLGYDRGGNSFKVNMYMNGKNKTTNMHYIWDSLLPEYYIHNYAYTVPFEKIRLPANFTVDKLLEKVLNENIKDIACKIYPHEHYLIFNDYFNDAYFMLLFDNYHKMLTLILKYIYNNF